jgi:glycosyltransferase involved in cell wall biosynthesis
VREEFGFDATAPVAGSLAVLRPEKNLRSFVRAAAQVLHSLPAARFVIVGDGPQRQELFQEIMLSGLEGRVVLAGWRDDLPEVLSALDVAVLCSTDVETFPMAFLEAMAAGLPLVGTRVGGLPEMILPGENGLLVEPGSTEELAQALGQVLSDPDRARRWGEASRRRVRQEFAVERMVQRYEALFESLLASSEAPPDPRSR